MQATLGDSSGPRSKGQQAAQTRVTAETPQRTKRTVCVCVCVTRPIIFNQCNSVRHDTPPLYSSVRTAAMFGISTLRGLSSLSCVCVCVCVRAPRNPFESAQTARFNNPVVLSLLQTMCVCVCVCVCVLCSINEG